MPRPARSFAAAIARMQRVLRDLHIYVARLRKRLLRGAHARIIAVAPPAQVLSGAYAAAPALTDSS